MSRLTRRIQELEEAVDPSRRDVMRVEAHRRFLLALHRVYGEEGSEPPDVRGLTIEDVERDMREAEQALDAVYSEEVEDA